MITENFRVSCKEFEGPLDLLLYLVRKQEVAIRDISLSRITSEYFLFIKDLKEIDFNGAGEFIRYAATLLAIKAREISKEDIGEGEEEELETKESLIQRLEEYKKFKGLGLYLKKKLEFANTKFERPSFDLEKRVDISLDELKEILESIKKQQPIILPTTILFHIDDLIDKLLKSLKKSREFFLSKIVKDSKSTEKVGLFFALLEIIRRGKARAIQKEPFGEILVKRR